MAMGRRKGERQDPLWIAGQDVVNGPGSPFYAKLNTILAKAGFDSWIEERCRKFYAEDVGQPGIPPGIYFRMLLIGYFCATATVHITATRVVCPQAPSLPPQACRPVPVVREFFDILMGDCTWTLTVCGCIAEL